MSSTQEQVAAALKSIAANIRRYGHYQRAHSQGTALFDPQTNPAGLCCVNVNPMRRRGRSGHFDQALDGAVSEELKRRVAETGGGTRSVITWNDNTPTDEVLAVLER